MNYLKSTLPLFHNTIFYQCRFFRMHSPLMLKQIQEVKNGKELVISGTHIESNRVQYLLKNDNPECCAVCTSGLDIKHTDVLILSQFVRSDGCMLPKRVTGLCHKQQRRVSSMVTMAQKAGLMPNLAPARSKKDPSKRYKWKQFNTYFDENTIRC